MHTTANYQPLASDAHSASGEFLSALQTALLLASPSGCWHEVVDGCWELFLSSLPEELYDAGRRLPVTLRLCSRPMSWSRIYADEVSLALPLCLAPALPRTEPDAVRRAVMAHLLGLVAALGTDRLHEGLVRPTPVLLKLLAYVRKARDAALESFHVNGVGPAYDHRAAERAADDALRVEQSFLATTDRADFETYECLSINKQWRAFPAAMTFARAAGLDGIGLSHLSRLCLGLAMGRKMRDDATRWEDERAGRPWALRLLRHAEGHHADERGDDLDSLRERMADTGVIVALLHGAAQHLERAADAAMALSATRVAAWAAQQARLTRAQAHRELRAPASVTSSY